MRYLVVLISLIALAGCAGPQVMRQTYPPEQILHLNQFRNLKDADAITRHVAYLDEGEIIPLKIKIESDLIGVYQDQVDLILKKKTYFRVTLPPNMSRQDLEKILTLDQERLANLSQNEKKALFKGIMLYISPDASRWAPLDNKKAIKEVFGLGGGEMSLGLAISETDGIWALFVLTIHKRAEG